MGIPRKPNDGVSQGGGASRVGGAITTAGPVTTTAWTVVDGAADLKPGEYELLARSDVLSDVLELVWASCKSAGEQAALAVDAVGRGFYLNSPILISVQPGLQRLSVRARITPPGAGYSVRLTPVY